jgi:hypothetical protein
MLSLSRCQKNFSTFFSALKITSYLEVTIKIQAFLIFLFVDERIRIGIHIRIQIRTNNNGLDPGRLKIYGSGTPVKNMDSEVSNVNEDKLFHEYIDMLQSSFRKFHHPSQNPTSNSLRGKATVSK